MTAIRDRTVAANAAVSAGGRPSRGELRTRAGGICLFVARSRMGGHTATGSLPRKLATARQQADVEPVLKRRFWQPAGKPGSRDRHGLAPTRFITRSSVTPRTCTRRPGDGHARRQGRRRSGRDARADPEGQFLPGHRGATRHDRPGPGARLDGGPRQQRRGGAARLTPGPAARRDPGSPTGNRPPEENDADRCWFSLHCCSQPHPVRVATAQLSISSITLSSVIPIAGGTSLNREVRQTRTKPTANAPGSRQTEPDVPRHQSRSDLRQPDPARRCQTKPVCMAMHGMQKVRGSNPLSSTIFRMPVR
jgi:hypothetical protein